MDKEFYAEALRRENFDVDAQQVRAYFDFAKVRAGLLDVTGRLFDVEYVEVPDAATWHADVTTYDVMRGRRRGWDGSTSTCTRGRASSGTRRSST